MSDDDGYLSFTIRWNPKSGHLMTMPGGPNLTNSDIALMLMMTGDAFLASLRGGAGGPDTKRGSQISIRQPGLQVRRIP